MKSPDKRPLGAPRSGLGHALPPLALAACLLAPSLHAQERPLSGLPDVTVSAHYDNALGSSDAASEGTVTSRLLQSRPTLRPAEVLEFVPGVIVSQHSGDGKANQYYLRGFNLDHGTDFATHVDGMPVNMPTHAHGQGYTDLNFLIPELVRGIHYRKGTYAAEDGDFSSAGSARIGLVDRLPHDLASLTLGEHGYARALLARNAALATGQLLYAVDLAHNDGPWDHPENFRRLNAWARYSHAEGDTRHTLTAMAYAARWDSTDQIPQRAVDDGRLGRFDAVDPTDHGSTRRASLSWQGLKALDDGEWRAHAYVVSSGLALFSNFTYYLDNPIEGDQFEQSESRVLLGGALSRTWRGHWADTPVANTLGLQARRDRIAPLGLHDAVGGQRTTLVQESRVTETSLGLYGENEAHWATWLRTTAALRVDGVDMDVNSSLPANSGSRTAWIGSPKLSLVLGPWASTEWFVNAGRGFHSNDARGVTAHVTAREGSPTPAASPLVRTEGREVGLRGEWLPGLQTSVSLWQLKLDSELVFVGDAGETAASAASTRRGIELNNHYAPTPWLLLDADLAFSHARFDQPQGEDGSAGRHVPGAVRVVASVGATVLQWGPWSGHLQLRYFGPRPLTEDGTVRSKGTTLAYARLGYQLTPDLKLNVDVFNLFDRKASDIDYYYTSRLPGEDAAGVAGVHAHPAEPRTVRLTASLDF